MEGSGKKSASCSKLGGKSLKDSQWSRHTVRVFERSLWVLRENKNWKGKANEGGAIRWEALAVVSVRAQHP